MPQSAYLQRVNAIRRQPQQVDDVARGLQSGEAIGKLLGGLGTAIQAARKDQIANQLLTDQAISDQPGAGQTIDLGTLPSDGGSSGGGAGSDDQLRQAMAQSRLSSSGQAQDLGYDPSFTDPATGDIQPVQDPNADQSFQSAIAAARLGGTGPAVGSVGPQPGGPQPRSNAAPAGAQPATGGGDNWNLSGFGGGSAFGDNSRSGTVGGLIGTGGVQGLALQKEMAAQQLQKSNAARAAANDAYTLADRQAKAGGTGPYAMDAAIKRAQLAKAQAALNPKPAAAVKNPPAVNIGSEPVIDQNQLNNHIDSIYGKGASNDIAATLNEAPSADPNLPNPNAPVVTGNSVTVGPAKNRITMPLGEAQIYTKQANALRIKQGLPPYPVPGETDQSVGASAANPYIAKNNLDVYSRPPGSWVRLPNGKIAQVPGR